MTRTEVQRLVLAREPGDAKEEADQRLMLAFLDSLPAPFSRDQESAHFTASALVLDEDATRTALVHHGKLGIWVQPGGHLDPGDESVEAAALREVKEETGLDGAIAGPRPLHLDIHEIPAREDMPAHLHLDIRFLVFASGEVTVSEESRDVRWLPLEEAVELGDASVARLVASL